MYLNRIFLLILAALPPLLVAAGQADVPTSINGTDIRTGSRVEWNGTGDSFLGTVFVFLSAKCPCSLSHRSSLKQAALLYPQFRFVGIHSNQNEPDDSIKRAFNVDSLNFPVIEDPDLRLANRFKAVKTPHVFVVGKNGEIQYRGGVDDHHLVTSESQVKNNYLVSALGAIVAGHKIDPKETSPLGCYIR